MNFLTREEDDKLVVFIHGITGNGEKTWLNKKTQFYFPKEIFTDLKGFSVYIFHYDSNLIAQNQDFYQTITTLKKELDKLNVFKFNEIIFVAHSMGGLIAKSLAIDPIAEPFASKISRLILLSTPNNGNHFANIISYLSQNPQFSNLKTIDNNQFLQILTNAWIAKYGKNGMAANSIQCYCAYEEKRTFLKVLVPLYHVSSPCCDSIQGFSKNHLNICKPLTKEDVVYQWVKEKIEYALSEIDRSSKKALYALYNEKIMILENKIYTLEKILTTNFTQNISSDFSSIEEYLQLLSEKDRYTATFKQLDKFIAQKDNFARKSKMSILASMIEQGELQKALDVFSDEEIDQEINNIEYNIENTAEKIKVKILLYELLNQLNHKNKYFDKLLRIQHNDQNILQYANHLKEVGQLKNAEDMYINLLKITNDNEIQAMCYNNLATLTSEKHLSWDNGSTYLKNAIAIYKLLLEQTNDHFILVKYIESKINLCMFDYISTHNPNIVTTDLKPLLKEIDVLEESSTDYINLKFIILSNIFGIEVDNLIFNECETNIKILDNIVYLFENSHFYVIKSFAEKIISYYENKGSYFGYLYKNDANNIKLCNEAIKNFKNALRYLQVVLPSTFTNNKNIIEIQKRIAISYADANNTEESTKIFQMCLENIEELINKDREYKNKYLELKADLLINLSTIDTNCHNAINLCKQAISILDTLNQKDSIYDFKYARFYMLMIVSMCKCQFDKSQIEVIHKLAINKLATFETNEAARLKKSLLELQQIWSQ